MDRPRPAGRPDARRAPPTSSRARSRFADADWPIASALASPTHVGRRPTRTPSAWLGARHERLPVSRRSRTPTLRSDAADRTTPRPAARPARAAPSAKPPATCCRCTAATTIGWASADWQLRRGRIVLLAGDSPAGLRLPLESISWSPPPADFERSIHSSRTRRSAARPAGRRRRRDADAAPHGNCVAPTAIWREVRAGMLYVFLPPTEELEHFVDLIAAVEARAAKIDARWSSRATAPPSDPRLQTLSVTPDPGVIEVNVQPATSWDELRQLTRRCTRRPVRPGLARSSSTSTAPTAAPAAAITSRSAA